MICKARLAEVTSFGSGQGDCVVIAEKTWLCRHGITDSITLIAKQSMFSLAVVLNFEHCKLEALWQVIRVVSYTGFLLTLITLD